MSGVLLLRWIVTGLAQVAPSGGDAPPIAAAIALPTPGPAGSKGDKGDEGAPSSIAGPPGASAGNLVDGVVYFPYQTAFGATPGNIRYEMNAGGQAAFDPSVLQVASVGGPAMPYTEYFRFGNDPKAAGLQMGKSRGHGDPDGDPATFHRKSRGGDRLGYINMYGSSDSGFSHSGYIQNNADADSLNTNEQPGYWVCYTSNATSNGNGWEVNSRGQIAFPGPHQDSFGTGRDFGAVVRIGAGSTTMPPLGFTPGPLTTVPVPFAVEVDERGVVHATDIEGSRRAFAMYTPTPAVMNVDQGIGLCTLRQGANWAELTIVIGPADVTGVGLVARLDFESATSNPVALFGSVAGYGSTASPPDVQFDTKNNNRLMASLVGGVLEAGQIYKFKFQWQLP